MKDYTEFIATEPKPVPAELTEQVYSNINKLLYPSVGQVFAKLFAIHLITGFVSLSFCTQFGINPFGVSRSLSDVFMELGGHGFCMLACGLLFISISMVAAGLVLTIEEIRALRHTEFLQTLSLGLISLGLFAAFGAEMVLTFAGLWLLGGLLGGYLATEAVWQLKKA